MPLRRALELIGVLTMVGGTVPGMTASAQSPRSYYCYASSSYRGTLWITALRPAGPDVNALQDAWVKYVKANFLPSPGQYGAVCESGGAEAMAQSRKLRSTQFRPTQMVEVDWSFWKNAETPEAAAALNRAAAAGQYVLCYSSAEQSPMYLSSDIHIDVPKSPDHSDAGALSGLKAEFLAYIKADRGFRSASAYPAECAGAVSVADLALERELLHKRFPQLTLVETGWTPGMTPKSAPSSAPAAPAGPASPSAYEKALAAQRPASAQAPTAPLPPDVPGRNYTWCWVLGHPPHLPAEAARSVFYVSGLLEADGTATPTAAFEDALRTAHPQEQIRGATCTAPQPMSVASKARDTEVAARRNSSYMTVLQVDWKP
jgi:hypothetical protein